MPLKTFFEDQITLLKEFLAFPGKVMLVVQHPSDLKRILQRTLLALEEDEDLVHVIVVSNVSFVSPEQYIKEMLLEIYKQNDVFADDLAGLGVNLPRLTSMHMEQPGIETLSGYLSDVAASLPTTFGSFVVIVDPDEIGNESAFAEILTAVVQHITSPWMKFITLGGCQEPIFERIIENNSLIEKQNFNLPMDKIESEIMNDLSAGNLKSSEKMRYTALAGSFAFAKKDYEKAEKLQSEVLSAAKSSGDLPELANALYNLGNTCLEMGKLDLAEVYFAKAADICMDCDIPALMAMVMINLGIVLQRRNEAESAFSCFTTARRVFKALNNPPGEAYALDCMAAAFVAERRNDEAKSSWMQALEIYDGITNEALGEIREAGAKDIKQKLDRFSQSIAQKSTHSEKGN